MNMQRVSRRRSFVLAAIVLIGIFASAFYIGDNAAEWNDPDIVDEGLQDSSVLASEDTENAPAPTEESQDFVMQSDEDPLETPAIATRSSLSGFLWVDGNGMNPTDWDGLYNGEEKPLSGFPVFLYAADDLTAPLDTTATKSNGTYIFDDLQPGNYVVGLEDGYAGSVQYLTPMAVTSESVFEVNWDLSDADPPYTTRAYTAPITLGENEDVENINAGMRLPMGVRPTADVVIDLDSSTPVSGTGYVYDGTILTFNSTADSDTNTYTVINGNAASRIVFLTNTIVTVRLFAVSLGGTNAIELQDYTNVTLMLENKGETYCYIVGNIFVSEYATLTIDSAEGSGETDGTLSLALLTGDTAGIGGAAYRSFGKINISGGTVLVATGIIGGAGIGGGKGSLGGTININGGYTIMTGVNGGIGAGIGGGVDSGGGDINISGGTVEVSMFDSRGAGIGGGGSSAGLVGGSGGTIAISGGYVEVNCNGDSQGAGIGGGGGYSGSAGGDGGIITISDSAEVIVKQNGSGAGIGGGGVTSGGIGGTGGDIEISGGAVTVIYDGTGGAGIGGGALSDGGNITITDGTVNVNVYMDTGKGLGSGGGAGIGGGLNEAGGRIVIEGGAISVFHSGIGAAIGGGANSESGTIVITGGDIEAHNYDHGAAIGGGSHYLGAGGSITISGNPYIHVSGYYGAGIGGGAYNIGYTGTINISGGVIEVDNSYLGAGIGGGGYSGGGGNIIISGDAEIMVNHDGIGAGIGGGGGYGGNGGDGGSITVSDSAEITINQRGIGAGIGGGGFGTTPHNGGSGGDIKIYGGTIIVEVNNTGVGAGIGGGAGGNGGNIDIYNGNITVINAGFGAAIGGGNGTTGAGGTIKISGSPTIYAQGCYGAGIGGGHASLNGADLTISSTTAKIMAYSMGGTPQNKPAIDMDKYSIVAVVYFVNAEFFPAAPSTSTETSLTVIECDSSGVPVSPLNTLICTLPENYRCFAFTTLKSGLSYYRITLEDISEAVVRVDDNEQDIYSIFSLASSAGYSKHQGRDPVFFPAGDYDTPRRTDAGVLPVTFEPKTNIVISKQVTGIMGSKTMDWEFTVTLTMDGALPPIGAEFYYERSDGTDGIWILELTGTKTFSLMHGQSLTIKKVPSNAYIQIVETTDSNYTTLFTDNDGSAGGYDTGAREVGAGIDGVRAFDFENKSNQTTPTGIADIGSGAVLLIIAISAAVVLLGLVYAIKRRVIWRR